ncbi:MAG: iron chelate uptake ABC transporter family permease subunit [Bacillaceae bacterium]
MSNKQKILLLSVIAIGFILVSLFYGIHGNWDYILPRRITKLLAIVLTGTAIAIATVVFQTITNNRILTPNVLGLDSLYMLIQTGLIFIFGSTNLTLMNKNVNFLLSIVCMILFATVLFKLLFQKERQNIYLLLLVGIVVGTFFQSISSFMQVLIDPNEFQIVQDKMFASFNNVNSDLVIISIVVIVLCMLYLLRFVKYLDALSLGRDHAINLGIDYDAIVKRLLAVIVVFISIATALVGPITFLGLLVANVSYELFKTYKHSYFIIGSILISIITLVGGQFIVEKVFTFSTTLSVIINFVGGIYFIYLLLRERES